MKWTESSKPFGLRYGMVPVFGTSRHINPKGKIISKNGASFFFILLVFMSL
jgi:hypothetical protein